MTKYSFRFTKLIDKKENFLSCIIDFDKSIIALKLFVQFSKQKQTLHTTRELDGVTV